MMWKSSNLASILLSPQRVLQLRDFVVDLTQRPILMVSDVKPKVWQLFMLMFAKTCTAVTSRRIALPSAAIMLKFSSLQVNQALKLVFVIDCDYHINKQNYDAAAWQNTDAYSEFMTLCRCWTKHNVLSSS